MTRSKAFVRAGRVPALRFSRTPARGDALLPEAVSISNAGVLSGVAHDSRANKWSAK